MTRALARGWIAVVAASAAVSGCHGAPSPTAPTAATVTSIGVTTPGTNGATFQLTAIARMSDNSTADVTQTAAWDSSNTKFATVSAAGLVTVQASGEVDLRATYRNISGSVHAVVVRATLVGVSLSGVSNFDAPFQLTATARLSDGSDHDVTNAATWDSSDTTRATVSTTGLVTVVGDGDVDVRATYQGMSDAWHLSRETREPATPVYSLTGFVLSTSGIPISGADVRVLDPSVRGNPTVSDALGVFTFSRVANGRYTVEIAKPGYQILRVQVLMADEDLHISVTLRLDGEGLEDE